MKYLILPFIVMSSLSPSIAQTDSIYAYYDLRWSKLDDKTDAKYFRVVKDRPDGKYVVRDYYMSGKLQFVGICTALEPKLVIEGDGTLYHESGGVQQVGRFEEEEAVGLHKYYYEDGKPHKAIFHRPGEKPLYHQFWSREGEEKLVNGTGTTIEYFDGRPTVHNEIEDSVSTASFSEDAAGNRVYMFVEQLPEYRGGYAAMINHLKARMTYPKMARRRGIEGTVYVSFLIGKAGEVTEVHVIKGIHETCDAEAVRVVSTLNAWSPGMHKGQPVSVRFVLPIKFNLRG